MGEVDLVLGNVEKLEAASYTDFGVSAAERVRVNDIMSVKETASQFVDSFEGRARAFLQIQNGCDHRCTFCIIPYGRGNSRSVPMGAIVEEAERLVAAGFPEIVLTGVDLTSYGADLPGAPTLGALVRKILKLVPRNSRGSGFRPSIPSKPTMTLMAGDRGRGAADAAFPSFGAVWRQHDPQGGMKRRHSRSRHDPFLRRCARASARCRVWGRLHRGFPYRDRGDVREFAAALVDDAGLSMLHVLVRSARARARRPRACRKLPQARS